MFYCVSKTEERGCLAMVVVMLLLALVGDVACVYAAWWGWTHWSVVRVASGVDGHDRASPCDVARPWAGPSGAHHLAVEAMHGRGRAKVAVPIVTTRAPSVYRIPAKLA